MKIKDMFKDDINRTINGVVQVEQDKEDVVEQELKEYVVTSELKKHFTKFFNAYSESFDTPTDNVGVWITGFFGSGKSHFLKMLSYLLENKEIKGKKTVDYFEEKFDDDLSFMPIKKSTQVPTETILFNIDVEGPVDKDDTAVLKVFAKVFYDHLGFYGNDLKLAKLEQFIAKEGKMDEFKKAFKEINGEEWLDSRENYNFFEDDVIEALEKANVMSKTNAEHWFDGTETADINIGQLVEEIDAYVKSKGKDFRLLFMIDEAGQYIGTNTSMLLNLQTLIEKLGSVCRGQVWVVATGQEALDQMIKLRENEFSRIRARFAITLSLTSSSVDEVIEKRLLTKTDEANKTLDQVYENNEATLKNLYSFDTEVKDIKGFSSDDEFKRIFPFIPYQFTIMQKVFNEIRKHGHAGKHQSSGERSMLNGFQESAQDIEEKDELSLVPMYEFYGTLHSFLDTSVRSVIERAEKAANNNNGLTKEDVNLLKLLYLVRYIDDIKSNIENLTILMADRIDIDKIKLRESVKESLDRLIKQNYIARNGDIYQFLTNEEQDIAREISNTNVDTAGVIAKVAQIIFDDVYTSKKYKYKMYDFDFEKWVDGQNYGNSITGMKLRFITEASDDYDNQLKLTADSKGDEAICELSNGFKYFENIESALKINKYIKQKNVNQLPESIQNIIKAKQSEANRLNNEAKEQIEKAILNGKFYIDGELVKPQGTSAKAMLDRALENLVEHTYSKLNEIGKNANDDNDIKNVLNGQSIAIDGIDPNAQACNTVYNYLDTKASQNLPVSMYDIQDRYHKPPYGWTEADIALVVAQLIYDQKVTIKKSGQTIQPSDPKLVDYLRKKSEISSTNISKRENIPTYKLTQVKTFLKEYFDCIDVPSDENGLISFIIDKFENEKASLVTMEQTSQTKSRPGTSEIKEALRLVNDVLLAKSDNIALVNKVCELQDDLLDSKDNMHDVENFYNTQVSLYDNAVSLKNKVTNEEKDYLSNNTIINEAVSKIADIVAISNTFKYNKIPELNSLISTINDERKTIVETKKSEIKDLIDQCISEIEIKANNDASLNYDVNTYKDALNDKKGEIDAIDSLPLLEAKKSVITSLKDTYLKQMDNVNSSNEVHFETKTKSNNKPKKVLQRAVIFEAAELKDESDIDKYLSKMKSKLKSYLNDNVIEIK